VLSVLRWLALGPLWLPCDDLEVEDVAETSVHEEVEESVSVHEGSGSGYRGSNDDAIATVDADDATSTYCFVLDYRIRDPFAYFILFGFYGWTDRVGVV
jgi:hypothetical protein